MSKPYPCVYCTEDGYCKKYSDEQVTSWCVQSPCKDEKPSNADRIRGMSDEELAEFLWDVWKNKDPFYKECVDGWLVPFFHWLKQEAEE